MRFLPFLALLGVCAAPVAAQNLLAFTSKPCPPTTSANQLLGVIPINVGGISIPFTVCFALGTGLSLDLTGPVPVLNAQIPSGCGTNTCAAVECPTGCFGLVTSTNADGSLAIGLNTAVAETLAVAQSGAPVFCDSKNGTTAYTCALGGRALMAYTLGMFVLLHPDVPNTGPASVNINGVGQKSIKQSDGTTDPGNGQLAAGRFYWLFYDGNLFRMQ